MDKPELILLVEDDDAMRTSCQQALEEAGYRILPASSPRDAQPILAQEALDLVITDLRMPDGGGAEVIRLVTETKPSLPVVVITAYPSVESAANVFKSGIVDYILKPFTVKQLTEAVERNLRIDPSRSGQESSN